MDGQLNDLFPESECCKMAAEEMERHKAMKAEIKRKMDEAARQKAAAEETLRKKAAEEARRKAEEEARRKAAEEEARRLAEEQARKKAEQEEAQRQFEELQREMEEARRKAAEAEEAKRKAAEEAQRQAEEEARQKAKEDEARRQFEEKQKAMEEVRRKAEKEAAEVEMAAMDERCVNTFLECVKPCSWRDRIRTPIKGTILYTKHMRPCRAMGTSVDVKDSSFHCLSNFLKFLEEEGLLRLKPGLTDPVVTDIRTENCKHYTYVARPKPSCGESPAFASPSPWSTPVAFQDTPSVTGSSFKAPPLSWQ